MRCKFCSTVRCVLVLNRVTERRDGTANGILVCLSLSPTRQASITTEPLSLGVERRRMRSAALQVRDK